MNNSSVFKIAAIVFAIVLLTFSCKKPDNDQDPSSTAENMEGLVISPSFDYENTTTIPVSIHVLSNTDKALKNIRIDILTEEALENSDLSGVASGYTMFSGATNQNGWINTELTIPNHISEVIVSTNYIGLPAQTIVSLESGMIELTLGGISNYTSTKSSKSINVSNYGTLGSWNSNGVPNYLEQFGDTVDQGLLDDINASLPEGIELTISHPQYLQNVESWITLQDSAEVWVTFIHEGAGFKNALGYYIYNINTPPATVNDITNHIISFPNASYNGSGGGLSTGDKVQLQYYDELTQTYNDTFPPDVVIGWFIVADGFNSSSATINSNKTHYYSNPDFNPENNASNRQHNVVLYDESRELLLIGFEDLNREGWCDQDFNDAIFYTTVSPIEAVVTTNIQKMDTPGDTDNDGISDVFDEYPDDPTRAFNNYYPNSNTFGTLAFEDLWPGKGDYDFNDLVIEYQINRISNGQGNVVEIISDYIVKAIGAGYHNGFGIEYPFASARVSSVSGGDYSEGIITLNGNGTEAGNSNAVVMIFEDAYDILPYPGGSTIGVNTSAGGIYVTPDTMRVTITMDGTVSLAASGTPPYNPFIFIDGDRTKEVHLPDKTPTVLANTTFFGTSHDDSEPLTGRYYKTSNNLPWAIDIPVSFDYPLEKIEIISAHLKFGQWAENNGSIFSDWYLDNPGYRNSSNIFAQP